MRSLRLEAERTKTPAQQPWQLQAPPAEGPQGRSSSCYPLPLTWGAFLFPAQLLQQCAGPGSSLPWRLDVLLDLTVDGAALLRGDARAEVLQVLVLRGAMEAGCPGWRQLADTAWVDPSGDGDAEPALFCLAGLCGVLSGYERPRVVHYEVLRPAACGGGEEDGGGGELAHVGVWVETG